MNKRDLVVEVESPFIKERLAYWFVDVWASGCWNDWVISPLPFKEAAALAKALEADARGVCRIRNWYTGDVLPAVIL